MDKQSIDKKVVISYLLLVLVAAFWGAGFVAGKVALQGLQPEVILMYRFLGSAAIIGLLFFRKIIKATKKEILFGCFLGLLFFLGRFVQLFGLQYTTAAKQSFIAASYVAFTPFLAWLFFKSKAQKIDIAVAFVALAGVGMISLTSGIDIQAGDFISVGFAFIFASQIVFTGKYMKDFNVIVCTFYQFLCGGILSAMVTLISGSDITTNDTSVIFGVLYLTLIVTALATCMQNFAQQYTKESHVALILAMESVFGFVFSAAIYNDPFTPQMIFGGILVVSSVIISNPSVRKSVKAFFILLLHDI